MPLNPTLNNVREYKNYGISIFGNTYDPVFTKGWLNANPNISVMGSTCYFDYSNIFDISDRTFLKRTFGIFPIGTTFYVSSTEYYDEKTNVRTNIGGTCSFSSSFNDGKIIEATIVSGFTFNSAYNFYSKENFLTTPQYTFQYVGSTANNFILNSFPNTYQTSFKKMGFLGNKFNFEEYVEISGTTGSNYGKLKVDSVLSLKDNQEILYLTGTAQNQILNNSATELKMYIRGSSDVDEIQKSKSNLGIYRIQNQNNQLINCYENQNEYQVHLRKQTLGITQSGYWVNCETCPETIYGDNLTTEDEASNLLFDNMVFLYIRTDISTSFPDFTPVYSRYVLTQRNLNGVPQNASSLSFSVDIGLKIDLSHSSLQNWFFEIFADPGYTVEVSSGVIKSGKPGYNNAFVFLPKNLKIPNTLYCRLVGPTTLPVLIQI